MKRTLGLILALCPLIFLSCNGEDKKAPVAQAASDLYLDYKVAAEETAEYAVVLVHFRKGGAEANAIALEEGSQVSLDGQPLVADSARLAGVYYEAQLPLADFAGPHKIVYTDKQGQNFEQSFQFVPLTIADMPPVIEREDLNLDLGQSGQNSRIQVIVTDTSFSTADINEEYKAGKGQIVISKDALKKVANGPLTLELVKEEVTPLPNGRLVINYTLRRELELR
jgi:hypothetical protein